MQQLRIVTANQGNIHMFEKLKRKILSCNSDIQFNRICLKKEITPKFANITGMQQLKIRVLNFLYFGISTESPC
jgi:hypothetical protein